jgi:hypothetical protein
MTAEGKPIPTELRHEEGKLRHEIELEDAATAVSWVRVYLMTGHFRRLLTWA